MYNIETRCIPHKHHTAHLDRLKLYVEQLLQEDEIGDSQNDKTLGERGSVEDALDMMILPVSDPYLTQEDAILPPHM